MNAKRKRVPNLMVFNHAESNKNEVLHRQEQKGVFDDTFPAPTGITIWYLYTNLSECRNMNSSIVTNFIKIVTSLLMLEKAEIHDCV